MPGDAPASPHEALRGSVVYRASDGAPVDLTEQWREDETALVVFLRSFGCARPRRAARAAAGGPAASPADPACVRRPAAAGPFCWEAAIALRRDASPILAAHGVKCFAIGIGTPARALDFVAETGFPAEILYADPENVTYDRLRLHRGLGRTFFNVATPFAMRDRFMRDGARDLAELLPRWKPWLPPKQVQALQQGGTFVFRGRDCVFQHYDESTGAHADLGAALRAAGGDVPPGLFAAPQPDKPWSSR